MDHSKWEYLIKMIDQITGLTTSFEYNMLKVFVRFSK
jgi:hypothetical protein